MEMVVLQWGHRDVPRCLSATGEKCQVKRSVICIRQIFTGPGHAGESQASKNGGQAHEHN